ncbi:MAG: hypothetical protein H6677_17610 [Candidatus Obscuribacterales bacterium]|nr:hypothetical protein [Candidatus Obscuribacterales bacterium]
MKLISSSLLSLILIGSYFCFYPRAAFAQSVPTDATPPSPALRQEIKPVDLGDKRKSDSNQSQSDQAIKSDTKAKAGGSNSSSSQLPLRLLSFPIGFVVGTPIAIGRCAYKQTRAGTRDLVGDSTNPLLVVPATMISLPFGIMGGPFEGVGSAAINSWKGSGHDPFGPESFSLGSGAD